VLDRKTPNLPLDPYDEVNVVIDIRHPNEIETQGPLTLSKTVIEVPFFKLLHQFEKLDSHLNYGLYCQQGLMSRFQAKMLNEKGYNNVVPIQI
jgi:thiamine biosynthesis protein ThiI